MRKEGNIDYSYDSMLERNRKFDIEIKKQVAILENLKRMLIRVANKHSQVRPRSRPPKTISYAEEWQSWLDDIRNQALPELEAIIVNQLEELSPASNRYKNLTRVAHIIEKDKGLLWQLNDIKNHTKMLEMITALQDEIKNI